MASMVSQIWDGLKNVNPVATAVTVGAAVVGTLAYGCCWKGRRLTMVQTPKWFEGDGFHCKRIENNSAVYIEMTNGDSFRSFNRYKLPPEIEATRHIVLCILSDKTQDNKQPVQDMRTFVQSFSQLNKLRVNYCSKYLSKVNCFENWDLNFKKGQPQGFDYLENWDYRDGVSGSAAAVADEKGMNRE